MASEVKIVTINTWKCDGDYLTRMPILACQLKALQPDIIACQECFFSEEVNADTLKYLAEELQMNYTFLPGRSRRRPFYAQWVDSLSGLGILSTYPIEAVAELNLPAVAEDSDRKAQQAMITLPSDKKILITNTHFTHLHEPGVREKQAGALAAFVTANQTSPYHVICGDFNSTITSVEMKTFMNLSSATDCYSAGNGTEPRYSLTEAYYKSDKMICVDHIFALPASGLSFKNSAVVLNKRDEESGLYPSDHFGITTTLVIS